MEEKSKVEIKAKVKVDLNYSDIQSLAFAQGFDNPYKYIHYSDHDSIGQVIKLLTSVDDNKSTLAQFVNPCVITWYNTCYHRMDKFPDLFNILQVFYFTGDRLSKYLTPDELKEVFKNGYVDLKRHYLNEVLNEMLTQSTLEQPPNSQASKLLGKPSDKATNQQTSKLNSMFKLFTQDDLKQWKIETRGLKLPIVNRTDPIKNQYDISTNDWTNTWANYYSGRVVSSDFQKLLGVMEFV